MKEKIKTTIKIIFGTKNNIALKSSFSLFISGILFLAFSAMAKDQQNLQAAEIFSYISGTLLGLWLCLIQNTDSILEIIKELFRLFVFFAILIFSLDYCINLSIYHHGFCLIVSSILSCIGLLLCSFYLISKFVDIFVFIKNIFKHIKQKLFNSVQPATSKAKALIENITAFLVSIAGLGIAIKTIIEPLINLFK